MLSKPTPDSVRQLASKFSIDIEDNEQTEQHKDGMYLL
jgi:hypothetical protein